MQELNMVEVDEVSGGGPAFQAFIPGAGAGGFAGAAFGLPGAMIGAGVCGVIAVGLYYL